MGSDGVSQSQELQHLPHLKLKHENPLNWIFEVFKRAAVILNKIERQRWDSVHSLIPYTCNVVRGVIAVR